MRLSANPLSPLGTLVPIILFAGLPGCRGRHDSAPAPVTPDMSAARGDEPAIKQHLAHDDIVQGRTSIADVIEHGRQLFAANFNTLDGAGRPGSTGTGAPRDPRVAPQNFNRLSAPDANSCAGCHNLPFPGGGGDNVANVFVLAQRLPFLNFDAGAGDEFKDHTLVDVANERNTLGMFGAGYVELLTREMTRDLQAIRADAAIQAITLRQAVTLPLIAKGVDFGKITAQANGTVITTGVVGVDADLVVRPFHQKGVVVSLREFSNNAMNHHHGMQPSERFGAGTDPDGDGKTDELTDGDITAVTLFQATLPAPGRVFPGGSGPARVAVTRGESLFASLGCAGCHVPEMKLDSPVFTEPNPYNPPANLRLADVTAPLAVDLTSAGPGPNLPRQPDGSVVVHAYSDFKRHDMGPALDNEQLEQNGVPTTHFITRKLWGMANEPPFMHHGRALTLREAIMLHGGESDATRVAFEKLSVADQDAVIEFLKTLQVVEPGSAANEVIGQASGTIGDEPSMKSGHVDQVDIEAGRYSVEQLFDLGEQIFGASFNTLDGAGRPASTGTGDPRAPVSAPHNFNRLSGPDANSCAACHNMPQAGGGGDNVGNVFVLAQRLPLVNFDGKAGDGFAIHHLDNVGDERNTLGMWGSGFVEALALEMTAELHAQRDAALAQAKSGKASVTVVLQSKGVEFGSLTASASGQLDTSSVHGIDVDLVVKPFHQKGVVVSLRQFTNNALNHHHGMQASERFGRGIDADGDGKSDEVTPGDVTALTLYQALLAVPTRAMPTDAKLLQVVEAGERLFGSAGCTSCHLPSVVLDDPIYREPNPRNPVGNLQVAQVTVPLEVDLTVHGQRPRLGRRADGKVEVPLYSDFKRHYMGEECDNEKLVQGGVATGDFITKKLWGMASEPPFMHHGRALTLREAIEMHGGEAAASRQAFRALSTGGQRAVIDFLKTLQVRPAAK